MKSLHVFNVLLCIYILSYSLGSSIAEVQIQSTGTNVVGGAVNLTCSFPEVDDPQTVVWFKQHDIIFTSGMETFKSSRIQVPYEDFKKNKNHMLILNTAVLDDSSTYKCLIIEQSGVVHEGSFDLDIVPDIYTIIQGNDQELPCHVEHSKMLIWNKKKSIIVFNRTVIGESNKLRYSLQQSNLIIKNASSAHEGTYTCYSNGKRMRSYQVTLQDENVTTLPPRTEPSRLEGWRGIAMGAALFVLIVGVLAISCFIQGRPDQSINK